MASKFRRSARIRAGVTNAVSNRHGAGCGAPPGRSQNNASVRFLIVETRAPSARLISSVLEGSNAPNLIWREIIVTGRDEMEWEGELSKPYRLWHVSGQNEFVAVVAQGDTFEEIKNVRRRPDWRYQATRNGKPINEKTGFPILTLPGQDLTQPE
jgi:hypothetical protein